VASIFTLRAAGEPREVDQGEVARAIKVLVDPESGVELRALPSAKHFTMPGRDVHGLVSAAVVLGEDESVYYTLNPISPTLDHCARVGDILKRRWFLVDLDPCRPRDMSATAQEKEYARQKAYRVSCHLAGLGWPECVMVDSGNGYHLLYRVDLPNDDASHDLLKSTLHELDRLFTDELVNIDKSVHNASRIAKLPGTWARKGQNTPERPHRLCKLLKVPDLLGVVTAELLRNAATAGPGGDEFGQDAPVEQEPDWADASTLSGAATSGNRVAAYLQRAIDEECRRVTSEPVDGQHRNIQLNKSAYALGRLVGTGLLDRPLVEEKLLDAARRCGLPDKEARATVKSGIEAGKAKPRELPPSIKEEWSKQKEEKAAEPKPEQRIIIRANEVTVKRVEWLWPGRIPLGKMTTFAGLGGLGKTLCLCDITARVTRGLDWPDKALNQHPGQVIYISGEDDLDDTIVPRLIACGADLSKVVFLTVDVQDHFHLGALKVLEQARSQAGPDVRLVVVDPPSSYLHGVDEHKNAELRGLLTPIKNWCSKSRVAVIFNTHINKGSAQKLEAMMRVMGSVAWVNAVRAAHMFAADPDDRSRRLFMSMKSNNGPEKKGLAYRIQVLPGELAKVEWLGEVDTTADQAVNRESGKPRWMVAAEWLDQKFAEKAEWNSSDLWDACKEEAVTNHTACKEAIAKLRRWKAFKKEGAGRDSWWVWRKVDNPNDGSNQALSEEAAF
jgi:hypothetical protein